jgi:hypothetical protein
MTRRAALKTAATFTILPTGLLRGYAANEKLNIGMIGLAGMGEVDLKTFAGLGENIVALCDVDSTVLDKRGEVYPKARKYSDFRKMIEKEKLDGVSIAVPDHSHCYCSVWAMKHGLHVYCQKPLTQTVHEARVVARVATETKAITQMGTQFSAQPGVLRTAELIRSGALGDITEVHITTDRPVWPQGFDRLPGETSVPSTLDWDIWLGPAPMRPYQSTPRNTRYTARRIGRNSSTRKTGSQREFVETANWCGDFRVCAGRAGRPGAFGSLCQNSPDTARATYRWARRITDAGEQLKALASH